MIYYSNITIQLVSFGRTQVGLGPIGRYITTLVLDWPDSRARPGLVSVQLTTGWDYPTCVLASRAENSLALFVLFLIRRKSPLQEGIKDILIGLRVSLIEITGSCNTIDQQE